MTLPMPQVAQPRPRRPHPPTLQFFAWVVSLSSVFGLGLCGTPEQLSDRRAAASRRCAAASRALGCRRSPTSVRPHLRGPLADARIAIAGRLGRILGLLLELGDEVEADGLVRLQVVAAMEVGRVVGAAGAVVDRGLRIGAQRTRTGAAGGEHGVRSHVLLDPVHHGVEQGLWLRPYTAAAVANAW